MTNRNLSPEDTGKSETLGTSQHDCPLNFYQTVCFSYKSCCPASKWEGFSVSDIMHSQEIHIHHRNVGERFRNNSYWNCWLARVISTSLPSPIFGSSSHVKRVSVQKADSISWWSAESDTASLKINQTCSISNKKCKSNSVKGCILQSHQFPNDHHLTWHCQRKNNFFCCKKCPGKGQTWYLSTNLRNRSFWPKKFTQKKHNSRQNQIRNKTA